MAELKPRNLNYFGTFLEGFKDDSGSQAAPAATVAAPARSDAPPSGFDDVLRSLGVSGQADFKDLLAPAGNSLDALVNVVNQLQSLGLVEMAGSDVRLTPDGAKVAAKLA